MSANISAVGLGERHTAAVTWILGEEFESCNQVCEKYGETCMEYPLNGLTTLAEFQDAMKDIEFECNGTDIWSKKFPVVDPVTKKCAYHHKDTVDETVCDLTAWPKKNLRRVCPCGVSGTAVAVRGDPRLQNLQGQKFDVKREGVNVLLVFPRPLPQEEPVNVSLRVDARVSHPSRGPKCKGWHITQLWINGQAVGEGISLSTSGSDESTPDAFEVKVGGRSVMNSTGVMPQGYNMTVTDKRGSLSTGHIHNRLKFAEVTLNVSGVHLGFSWFTGRKLPNSLVVDATGMRSLGEDWGGLLGLDDHTWISSSEAKCAEEDGAYARLPQLGAYEHGEVVAGASLD